MKGEAIARVRRQQGVVLKHQLWEMQTEEMQKRHERAMESLRTTYTKSHAGMYAGTYGGTVERAAKPWWKFWN